MRERARATEAWPPGRSSFRLPHDTIQARHILVQETMVITIAPKASGAYETVCGTLQARKVAESAALARRGRRAAWTAP